MDLVLSFVMDLLINCLFMNAAKPSQDCLLPEQSVIGQAIQQDFLGILLDRLSSDSKVLLENREGPGEKQQEGQTKQNDRSSGDMEGKADLLALLQPRFFRDQENVDRPSVPDGAEEKEEGAGTDLAITDLLKAQVHDMRSGAGPRPFLTVQTDDRPDIVKAEDELPDVFPEAAMEPVLMFQAGLSEQDQTVPLQDNVAVMEGQDATRIDAIQTGTVPYKQEMHLLKKFRPVEATEEKQLPIDEDSVDTELNRDLSISFQKKDIEVLKQKGVPDKTINIDEPVPVSRDVVANKGDTTVPATKRPKDAASPDAVSEKVKAVSGDGQGSETIKNEANFYQRGENPRVDALYGKEGAKALDRTAFGSVIADRVSQVVEQYANRNTSMDMVMRLKIDEKETILVGLKDDGQKITVQIKTGSEGVMSFIQSQKDTIMRHLEGKNIYANIMVDINDQRGFEKRDRRDQKEERGQQEQEEEFSAFLDALS